VALDEQHLPREISKLILETEEEQRRNREAVARRDVRLAEKRKEKECQLDSTRCEE
jgi:hypothetical protein